jgi:hypothetical protein
MTFLAVVVMRKCQAEIRPAPFWTGMTQAVGQRITAPPRSMNAASSVATSASCSGGRSRQRALWASMADKAERLACMAVAAGESGRETLLIY